jgi:hypothetical protein
MMYLFQIDQDQNDWELQLAFVAWRLKPEKWAREEVDLPSGRRHEARQFPEFVRC